MAGANNPAAPVEIEIKLTGAPASLKKAFTALGGGKPKSAQVVSVYYDTRDDRLWRKGYTLRLRQKGAGHELTLKSEGGGNLERGEWSSMLDAPIPDPGLLPATAPRGELGLILPEELGERHRTEVRRTKKLVELDDAVVEVSLDEGAIRAGEERMPVAELELELVKGDPAAILRSAERMLQRFPLALDSRSKAARGMALAQNAPPAWEKASKPALNPKDSVDTAIARILQITAAQVLANIAAAADGQDSEGVHQLRVALRRMRSAFSIFGGLIGDDLEGLNEQARHILKSLGDARDLDVFIEETMPPVLEEHDGAKGLTQLGERADEARNEAYGHVRSMLAEPVLGQFVLRVLLTAEHIAGRRENTGPIRDLAQKELKRRRKKVLKKGEGFETMPTPERHMVRIALKKLRYAVDFFQSLYPEDAVAPYQTLIKDLQDDFGTMNDAAVAEELAERLAGGYVEAMMGAALLKGWYAHRLKAVEPHMIGAWQQFCDARPFWKT
ncbi:MAG: CHAD domain-containing protein [Minwuia sp.]|uniref:CYTH and CHAD domain-containing protein n=1 Tax=Minwuia sp. TaxID=2493630 RepID=UPI003A8BEDE2